MRSLNDIVKDWWLARRDMCKLNEITYFKSDTPKRHRLAEKELHTYCKANFEEVEKTK